jgi:RNA polymerase sigma-70 factor (ECF subfamily)
VIEAEDLPGQKAPDLRVAYSHALRVTGNPSMAEEAVQEACARLAARPGGLAAAAANRTYFLRAVHWASTGLLRGESRRREHEEARSTMECPVPAGLLDTAVRREAGAAARAALAELPTQFRLAVSLCCEQGLTQGQAAEVLGVPRGTVAWQVSEGLARLRDKLESAGFGALAPAAIAGVLGSLGLPAVPAGLAAAVQKLAAGSAAAAEGTKGAAASAASKGGLIVKIGLGLATVGLVAGTTFLAVKGNSGESASPPAAKVPGKDYPYGEGVVYKRDVFFGSFATGNLDGPPTEVELYGAGCCRMPNGDWYILEEDVSCGFYRYDAKKKRVVTLSSGAPYGKLGGTAETMRLARGGYGCGMGMQPDPSGKKLLIFDRNNNGAWWLYDPETGKVAPSAGASAIQGAAVQGTASDGTKYFAMDDGKLKKMSPDGKNVQDTGVTLEQPLRISTFFGDLRVSEKTGRLYAGSRDPQGPWGIFWYWDMKTGKAVGLCGPKKIGGKVVAQDGGEVDKNFHCASGPADKVSFWCTGSPGFGPDRGERYLYLPGGDESTFSRLDLEKKYVTKMVHADAKDRSLWTFGDGRQGKDYRFADPYCWPGAPQWGDDGEFYMSWALCTRIDVYRPVGR